MTNDAAFESFYYDVVMFIPYIVCFVVKLSFNFIFSWFAAFTLQAATSQSHIIFTVSFMAYFYILNMPVHINTEADSEGGGWGGVGHPHYFLQLLVFFKSL